MLNNSIRKTAHINGIEVYYEDYRQSDPVSTVVLLHGFLSSSFSFRKLIPNLSQSFRVIAVDLPPFGESGKETDYTYSYHNMALTVLKLLTQLEVREFFVCGHSMGGQIALNMMHISPKRVRKGILLSSSSYYARAKKLHIAASYIPFFPFFVKKYLSKTGVVGNLNSVVFDQSLIDKQMIDGYALQFENPEIFRALAHLLRDREGDLSKEVLQTIKTPCLLLWGEKDKIVPLSIGKQLVKDLPFARLITLKNTGHLLPEEQPVRVYEEMNSFINGPND